MFQNRAPPGHGNDQRQNNLPDLLEYDSILHVVHDISSLWHTGLYSDLTIVVKSEKRYHVHKYILSTRSTTFHQLIQNIPSKMDGHPDVLDIFSFDAQVILEVLNYIYSGRVRNFETDLLKASNAYDLSGLKTLCENHYINEMNVLNVCSLLLKAIEERAERLNQRAKEYIRTHEAEVTQRQEYQDMIRDKPYLVHQIFGPRNAA